MVHRRGTPGSPHSATSSDLVTGIVNQNVLKKSATTSHATFGWLAITGGASFSHLMHTTRVQADGIVIPTQRKLHYVPERMPWFTTLSSMACLAQQSNRQVRMSPHHPCHSVPPTLTRKMLLYLGAPSQSQPLSTQCYMRPLGQEATLTHGVRCPTRAGSLGCPCSCSHRSCPACNAPVAMCSILEVEERFRAALAGPKTINECICCLPPATTRRLKCRLAISSVTV